MAEVAANAQARAIDNGAAEAQAVASMNHGEVVVPLPHVFLGGLCAGGTCAEAGVGEDNRGHDQRADRVGDGVLPILIVHAQIVDLVGADQRAERGGGVVNLVGLIRSRVDAGGFLTVEKLIAGNVALLRVSDKPGIAGVDAPVQPGCVQVLTEWLRGCCSVQGGKRAVAVEHAGRVIPVPFVAVEKEQPVLHDRPADCPAELLAAEGRFGFAGTLRNRVNLLVAIVAEKAESGAVPGIGA